MDSEAIDHHLALDKQNYVGHNDVDLPITPIPVVASRRATVQYGREGSSSSSSEYASNGSLSGENRPSLHQLINDTECVESTSNEGQVQHPQNTSLRPMLQRSYDSLPNLPLPNNPQESQSNLSTAMRSLSLTDQTTSLASFKDDNRERISVEGYYIGQQHPTNLSASMPTLPSSNINHNQHGHASGEEFQANQSQHALSNQEGSWNQPSNHHRPCSQDHAYQPADLVCPRCGKTIARDGSVHQVKSDYTGKKVFILHYNFDKDNPVLRLALTLIYMGVDVTLDLLEYDNPPNSWALWYEQSIKESDVVLCVITEDFYYKFTNANNFCFSVYDLMTIFRNVAFRALFIDVEEKKMEYIPPIMRTTTCYSVSSDQLTLNDEGFVDLYAFLTNQEKFTRRVGPEQNSIDQSTFGDNDIRMIHHTILSRQPPTCVDPLVETPDVNQANLIFILLRGDTTPISSCHFNKMFVQLASKMIAEWAPLGRMLGISEPNLYAINIDNIFSVVEQAVQMFRHWRTENGSAATFGVLATAVYESGPQYWNLLDIIYKYAPHDH